MWKDLIYNKITYSDFIINEIGEVKNTKTNHVYKPYIHKSGYVIITLPMGKRGVVKGIRLHKALAETFIPNPNNFKIVHHKDKDKQNYSLSNLEWTNNRNNTLYHIIELSKQSTFFNNRKLTKQDIEFIRNNKGIISYSVLAKQFNVSKTTITNIMNYKLYSNGVW